MIAGNFSEDINGLGRSNFVLRQNELYTIISQQHIGNAEDEVDKTQIYLYSASNDRKLYVRVPMKEFMLSNAQKTEIEVLA